jgi:hypothetical protein
MSRFPGRVILSDFVSKHVPGISYESFRNLVIDQMIDAEYEPPGMKAVIDAVLAA